TSQVSASISNGAYNVTLKVPDLWQVFRPGSIPVGKNQAIAANTLLSKGFSGVVARFSKVSDGVYNYYLFYIDSQGDWGCDVSAGGDYSSLVDPTASKTIKIGQGNRLEFDVVGNTLT